MPEKSLKQIEKRIAKIQEVLTKIGPMRPGSLTRQFKDPKAQTGPYWQISYTRDMKSRTEYVRREFVSAVRREVATYKRFKKLVDEWIALSIEASKLRMKPQP
ncbi:MAG: hypothetical protein MZV49_13330 [Rhodopseudomonas palustris]|nr:hypothetical protein [Rhodopseudomonas palustris]